MKSELELDGGSAASPIGAEGREPAAGWGRGARVVCAVLMPHAPVLVPEVGGERGRTADASRGAMRRAAACVLAHRPEALVLISPHSPRRLRAFGIWAEDPLEGSFAPFGAPQARVSLPLDTSLICALEQESGARGLETWEIHQVALDHGALVPLWFLAEAGWSGPTVVLSLSVSENAGFTAWGEVIAAAAKGASRRLAIVASGDMSHRLRPNAPCGFHPRAHQFDKTFLSLIQSGDYRKLGEIDPELRELAAEDAVDSTVIAASAANWETSGHEVLSYEGPYGVGYGVAILFSENPEPEAGGEREAAEEMPRGSQLPLIARQSVESALSGRWKQPPEPAAGYLGRRQGVFVTIRGRGGELRGCVGTIEATAPNILVETWRNARLAALQNHRFAPVSAGEMDRLRFEVSVIHPPEETSPDAEWDTSRYGVIVSARDGRRGLLLPGIEDIRTREQQIHFAKIKGGIGDGEPVTIERFQVDHFEEPV